MRRSYSSCAEPRSFADGSSDIRVSVKKDLSGLFPTWANAEPKAGGTLEELAGDVASHGEASFVAITADSGVTPVIAIARTLLAANGSPGSTCATPQGLHGRDVPVGARGPRGQLLAAAGPSTTCCGGRVQGDAQITCKLGRRWLPAA